MENEIKLAPFARRIRLLRAWRCGTIGGVAGSGVSVLLALCDLSGRFFVEPWMLAVPVGVGVLGGVLKAVFERITPAQIARSVDRRGGLKDRLTTASEIATGGAGTLAGAQHDDAARAAGAVRPATLYPLRAGRWHGALAALSLLAASVFIAGNTGIFKSAQARRDAEEMKKEGEEVQRIAKPLTEQAKKEGATTDEQELARRLEKFSQELRKARLSKPQALAKANDLAEQAQKLDQQRAAKIADSVKSAQTAAEKLEKMAQAQQLSKMTQATPEKMTEAQHDAKAAELAEQAKSLEGQIKELQDQLNAAKNAEANGSKSPLSKAQQDALAKKLAELQKKLKEVKLSQAAEEMLRKLAANKDFQEAQELLAKMAAGAEMQKMSDEQMQQLSEMDAAALQAEMEAAAKRMEELAKKLNSDAALQAFAKELLEAAKNGKLKMCNKPGLLGAFGLPMPGMGGLSSMMSRKGAGGPSNDHWVGAHNHIYHDDKSSLLNVPLEDRVITSQIGDKGAQSYTEIVAPAALGKKSAIPYQSVLPKYQKSAESALKKDDIAPQDKTRVRDYFNSLRQ